MPQTPGRPRRRSSEAAAGARSTAAGARQATSEHEHEPDSKLSTFTYRGRAVEIHAAEKGCCVVIDGERVDYVVDDDGIYSHELAYQKLGSPEELAEELIRQWGQARVERTPVPHDHNHDHGHEQ